MKEVSPEEAQEMYASLPGELQSALRENAVEVFREEGIEPTPDEVDPLLLSLVRYLMNSIYSRFSEITQEEVDRVMDEEFERHTQAASCAHRYSPKCLEYDFSEVR